MKTKKQKFKWSERQKRALRGSIRKWEGIVAGTVEDEGESNCPCCKMYRKFKNYFILNNDDICGKCPIAMYVGEQSCEGTPYDAFHAGDIPAAKKELNFIKKVLKAGE